MIVRVLAVLLVGLATAATAQTAAPPPAATPPAPPAAATPDPMDKMVCRRIVETGSLVRAQRKCHTKRQWAYLDEQNQTSARTLVDDTRTRPGGN